jgi:hypothetical protein
MRVWYAVVIKADGKRYTSWGAPTPPSAFGTGFGHARDMKSQPLRALPDNQRIRQPEGRTARDAIAKAWEDGSRPGPIGRSSGIVSTWNLPVLIAGAVAAACGVTAILL